MKNVLWRGETCVVNGARDDCGGSRGKSVDEGAESKAEGMKWDEGSMEMSGRRA
jgi:hypothetical protein